MNVNENNLIFEGYVSSLLTEDDVALRSSFKNILNVLERENITDPIFFFSRAHTLINKLPTTNASKSKIIQHLKLAQDKGIDGMKEYLKKAAGFYEKGGFVSKTAAQAENPIYHDPGWNKPPAPELLAMHFGDVVKYKGPASSTLNPNDDYMIVRREEHPMRNLTGQPMLDVEGRPRTKVTFFIKLYDSKKGDVVDPRELEKRIDNPNYLKHIGNNLEDKKRNFVRVGQSHIEDAMKKRETAQKIYQGRSKEDVNKGTRWIR